jgi:hypothetical protein
MLGWISCKIMFESYMKLEGIHSVFARIVIWVIYIYSHTSSYITIQTIHLVVQILSHKCSRLQLCSAGFRGLGKVREVFYAQDISREDALALQSVPWNNLMDLAAEMIQVDHQSCGKQQRERDPNILQPGFGFVDLHAFNCIYSK